MCASTFYFSPVGLTETEAINEAIEVSVREFEDTVETEEMNVTTFQDTTEAALVDSIKDHIVRVLTGNPRRIVVSRLRIWDTAKAFFKRKSFMAKTGVLKVTFANSFEEEDAIDQGGPRREFLHLLLAAICQDSGTLTSMLYFIQLDVFFMLCGSLVS